MTASAPVWPAGPASASPGQTLGVESEVSDVKISEKPYFLAPQLHLSTRAAQYLGLDT